MTEASSPMSSPRTSGGENNHVIGIYGLPGCGKTFLLSSLKHKLGGDCFEFFEGSDLIASVTPGGLGAFHVSSEQEKVHRRRLAIKSVADADGVCRKPVVIAGHYMFWKGTEELGNPVITREDLQTYTHILYLDVPADVILERRQHDTQRNRPQESVSHLKRWQETEKIVLRRLCYDHGILFSVVSGPQLVDQVSLLLHRFQSLTELQNLSVTRAELDYAFTVGKRQWKTLLVMDADKTLTAIDTGALFWKKVTEKWPSKMKGNPLRDIFDSKMHYTYAAFFQTMLLYEETLSDNEFDSVCSSVAEATIMYPEFISLLQAATERDHIGAVIVTCGLRKVWEQVLAKHGFSNKIKIIGGGRLANGYVVTGDTKAALVSHAKKAHSAYVHAFGDGPLDLGMLKEANRAIVVVGDEQNRSKSMENALLSAIERDDLRACQVVLPNTAKPRLSPDKLPTVQLTNFEFAQELLDLQSYRQSLDIIHATNKNAAKLFMTPMRDAETAGPNLRESHRLVGHYLATEYLSEINGIEEYPIPHVQGHEVAGYRFLHEQKTLIIPLMRGGEPMAFGVNDALPLAMFLHASQPEDIRTKHVHGRLNVILVDSVVNSGSSLLKFVQHIRGIHATVRIVAVVGVLQRGAMSRLEQEACCQVNFKLIALRLSDNKFKGKGSMDTGNRLFNTPHLD